MTKAEIQQVKLRFGIIGNNEALMRAIDIAIQVAQAWTVHCRELWSHSRRDD